MISRLAATACIFALFCTTGIFGQDAKPDPKAIVDQALEAYQSLDTLRVSGEAFADMKMAQGNFKMRNSFTMRLGRPDKFLVSWKPKDEMPMMPSGAVWNAGDGPFLFMGSGNVYTPMSDNTMAIAAATGVSTGAANTMPSLFFAGTDGFAPGVLTMLKDYQYSGEETLGNEACHVVTASSSVSKAHTLWISKDRHILLKHQYAMGGENSPDADQVFDEKKIKDSAEGLGGGEEGEALADEAAEAAKATAAAMKDMDILMGEVYTDVELNPQLTEDDFSYAVPADATKKESFFDAIGSMRESAGSKYNQKFQVGDTVPDFSGVRLDGSELKLADYKGKVVLLDFWATWCGPCVAELPNVVKTFEKYRDKGLEIIGISLDNSKDDLTAFLKEHEGVTWPILFDGKSWQGKIAQAYGVEAIPFALLIDGDGVIQARDLRGAKLDQAVESLLAQSGTK